jgi:hypothetical protein
MQEAEMNRIKENADQFLDKSDHSNSSQSIKAIQKNNTDKEIEF